MSCKVKSTYGYIDKMTDELIEECNRCLEHVNKALEHVNKAQEDLERWNKNNG